MDIFLYFNTIANKVYTTFHMSYHFILFHHFWMACFSVTVETKSQIKNIPIPKQTVYSCPFGRQIVFNDIPGRSVTMAA